MAELEPAAGGERHPAARRGGRWPWLIAGIVLIGVKGQAWAELEHHPKGLIPVLAIALCVTLLRPRPVFTAFAVAALAALVIAPHPLLAGAAFGAGAFAVLMLVFLAIATLLHARQRSRSRH